MPAPHDVCSADVFFSLFVISHVTITNKGKRLLVQVLSPRPSVGLSICLSGGLCMPFGMVGQLGPSMRQVVGVGDCPKRRGFWGGHRASLCNQRRLCGVVVWKCM